MQLTEAQREKFWSRVQKHESGCWFWTKVKYPIYQYGYFCGRGAHVVSFLLHGGVLTPEKPWVLHGCNRRGCVNPDHLRAGSHRDNMDDIMKHTAQKKLEREKRIQTLANLCAIVRGLRGHNYVCDEPFMA